MTRFAPVIADERPDPPATWSEERLGKPLSDREIEVVELIACGFTSKEIAAELGLSEHTIHVFRSQAMAKTGAGTSAALVARFIRAVVLRLPVYAAAAGYDREPVVRWADLRAALFGGPASRPPRKP